MAPSAVVNGNDTEKGKRDMGMLVDGVWKDVWYDTSSTGGRFERKESSFRNWVTRDGAPGPSGKGGFSAESGRYHLMVSFAQSEAGGYHQGFFHLTTIS